MTLKWPRCRDIFMWVCPFVWFPHSLPLARTRTQVTSCVSSLSISLTNRQPVTAITIHHVVTMGPQFYWIPFQLFPNPLSSAHSPSSQHWNAKSSLVHIWQIPVDKVRICIEEFSFLPRYVRYVFMARKDPLLVLPAHDNRFSLIRLNAARG